MFKIKLFISFVYVVVIESIKLNKNMLYCDKDR